MWGQVSPNKPIYIWLSLLIPYMRSLALPIKIFKIQPFISPTTSALIQAPVISCLDYCHKHISGPLLHPCFSVVHSPRGWPESKKIPMREGYSQSWEKRESFFSLEARIQVYEPWPWEAWGNVSPIQRAATLCYQPGTDPGIKIKTISDQTSEKYQDTRKASKNSFKGCNQLTSASILQNNLLRC